MAPPQFPVIGEFGENTNSYCSFETKETALLHSENGNLQQRVNVLTHEVTHTHTFWIRVPSSPWVSFGFSSALKLGSNPPPCW